VVILSDVRPPASPPYDTLEGALAGLVSAEFDVEEGLREMNNAWKSKLEKNQ
jgi:hypothetical protein